MFFVLISLLFILWTKNPLFAILSLICVFISSSGILLALDVNFLSLIYIVIYVGAICVLFLFVVMLLNLRQYDVNQHNLNKLPSIVFGLGYIIYYYYVTSSTLNTNTFVDNIYSSIFDSSDISLVAVHLLQQPLIFVIITILLLLAIVCPIVISINKKIYEKKHDLYYSLTRNTNTIIKVTETDLKKSLNVYSPSYSPSPFFLAVIIPAAMTVISPELATEFLAVKAELAVLVGEPTPEFANRISTLMENIKAEIDNYENNNYQSNNNVNNNQRR